MQRIIVHPDDHRFKLVRGFGRIIGGRDHAAA